MRDKKGYNKDSYVIKNGHIDCTKDTYEIVQRTIATPINNHSKYLMHNNYYLYFKWKENGIKKNYMRKRILIHYLIIHHLYRFS